MVKKSSVRVKIIISVLFAIYWITSLRQGCKSISAWLWVQNTHEFLNFFSVIGNLIKLKIQERSFFRFEIINKNETSNIPTVSLFNLEINYIVILKFCYNFSGISLFTIKQNINICNTTFNRLLNNK